MDKTRFRSYSLLAALLFAAVLIAACTIKGDEGVVVEIGDRTWVTEVADSPPEQTQGLMYRESMPAGQGMLFVFPDAQPRSFWMKNTKIPLDMIFISSTWRVVHIERNAMPCTQDPCPTYNSAIPAKYVLEVNAGQAVEKNVKLGAQVLTSKQFS